MDQTDKELDKLIEELEDKPFLPLAEEDEVFNFKIIPVWQFQSIEVEVKATKREIPKVMDLYTDLLAGLMKIAPEQSKQVYEDRPKVKLASDKQKEIMRKFDIPFTAETTAAEAQKLIQDNIDKASK